MTPFHIRGGIGAKILLGFVAMAVMIAALGGYGVYVLNAAGGIVADTYDRPLDAAARGDSIAAIRGFEYSSAAVAVLALLLAAAITFLLARRIVRPLALAARAADRIAGGELDTVIPRGGGDETGILLNTLSAMRDNIRAMMAREREQRRSAQSRLADALESSHEGMVLVDADGRVVVANSQMAEFFPALAAVIRPAADFAMIAPAMRGHLLRPDAAPDLAEIQANGSELQLADGRWIRVSRSSTRDGGGFFFFTDFTEVKERERRYREAQRQAEAASRAKSSFLANMSHELRTPLNAIIGFSEIMMRETMGPVGNPHYVSYLGDILQSGRHLLTVINGVLDLAKSESGTMPLHRESVNIAAILAECATMMRDQCARGGIGLGIAAADGLPPLSGDPAKLRQIFLNLLSNAVKFTDPGGTVSVRADSRGDAVAIEVRDTGIGMSAADIPLALSPFGQIDSRLARRYDGTGLGLPLAKELTERHGGTLAIESEPGKGTVIRVTLPIAPAAMSGADALAA